MGNCSCGRTSHPADNFCGNCGECLRSFMCKVCGHKQASLNHYCVQCGQITYLGMVTSFIKEFTIPKTKYAIDKYTIKKKTFFGKGKWSI